MKNQIIVISAILFFCFSFLTNGQTTFWKLEKDSMNLAILELDFQTYELKQGHFSVHKPCDNCDRDSLPFIVEYNNPVDFGDIRFYYNETNETIFYAEIVWMGMGRIKFPETFFPASDFHFVNDSINKPISFQYYNPRLEVDSNLLQLRVDSAWNAIRKLDIVRDFARNNYRVGIYLYFPSIVSDGSEYASWIIFLYQGKLTPTSVNNENTGITYISSNPFSESTTIHYHLTQSAFVSMNIYSSFGSKICSAVNEYQESGEQQFVFDGRKFPSGLYYYTIQIGDRIESGKIVLIK